MTITPQRSRVLAALFAVAVTPLAGGAGAEDHAEAQPGHAARQSVQRWRGRVQEDGRGGDERRGYRPDLPDGPARRRDGEREERAARHARGDDRVDEQSRIVQRQARGVFGALHLQVGELLVPGGRRRCREGNGRAAAEVASHPRARLSDVRCAASRQHQAARDQARRPEGPEDTRYPIRCSRRRGARSAPIRRRCHSPKSSTRLQQGVIDGDANPLTSIQTFRWYEAAKYVSFTNTAIGIGVFIINEPYLQKLPKAHQDVDPQGGERLDQGESRQRGRAQQEGRDVPASSRASTSIRPTRTNSGRSSRRSSRSRRSASAAS